MTARDRALTIAAQRGIPVHPNWHASQIWGAINWSDPTYRKNHKAAHERAMERIKAGGGWLYVAEVVGTDIVKIGHALDLNARVKRLKADHGVNVRMLASIPASLSEERRLHRRIRRHRSKSPDRGCATEFYPVSVLTHEAIPFGLRVAA